MSYHHTQPGTLNRVVIGAFVMVFLLLTAFLGTGDPVAMWVMLAVSGVLFLTLLMFHALTVEVRHGEVRIRFGIGLVRKTLSVKDIERVEAVRNRWWYGWGIRLTPHGWLFNVSGLDAVQLNMRNGRAYRIGTDEPEKLRGAIEEAMKWAR